jgi:hypothetical protein
LQLRIRLGTKNVEDFSPKKSGYALPGKQNQGKIGHISPGGGVPMVEKPPKGPFSVISALPLQVPDPPRPLGPAGMAMWRSIQAEYNIQDQGGVTMLQIGCQAFDRAERLRTCIDADGEVIHVRGVPRAHPALRDEVAARAQVMRCLEKLGLNLEPIKQIGRPPGSFNR